MKQDYRCARYDVQNPGSDDYIQQRASEIGFSEEGQGVDDMETIAGTTLLALQSAHGFGATNTSTLSR
jgi:hypothetical protein